MPGLVAGSKSCVYADANTLKSWEYWDYEAHVPTWNVCLAPRPGDAGHPVSSVALCSKLLSLTCTGLDPRFKDLLAQEGT
ncbi:Casein kinase II subunit alpha' [Liparis tanakae]|uniref:Casein kinase II subunit alpha n=1 Tax=Liparis tanakae TaxID=230148 RepID=A0A4Z2GN09_9TELE|nr:Casein kinase II subunit alpha' [Liparis tanakae]